MKKKRVLFVINKWWECDPVINVLLHDNARPQAKLGWPSQLNHPRRRPNPGSLSYENPSPLPRAIFDLENISAELWCVSDLLEYYPDQSKYQSSSELKAQHLPKIFKGEPANLVIAVGTAAYLSTGSENGSVVVGSAVFMHNAHPGGENPDSDWTEGPFDQLLPSPIGQATFDAITNSGAISAQASQRFMVPPLNPSTDVKLLAKHDYVSLGTINVTNSAEYAKADEETYKAYTDRYDAAIAKSIDTTHGLIRKQSEAAFIFISGIPNRVGHFADEVAPRSYVQNTAAAHNAGVAIAWMLPEIDIALA